MRDAHRHRAETAGTLVGALAEVLRAPLPTRSPRGSSRCPPKVSSGGSRNGCRCRSGSANIAFPHPDRLVADALAAGEGLRAEDDPWASGRLLWTVLGVIDYCLGRRGIGPLWTREQLRQ